MLGLGTDADELLPALVGGADEVFDCEAVVMVAAGFEVKCQLLLTARTVSMSRCREDEKLSFWFFSLVSNLHLRESATVLPCVHAMSVYLGQ